MHPRFFVEPPITGLEVSLTGDEAQHLMHVRRLGVGADVCLFDGSGIEFHAQVVACDRKEVRLTICGRQSIDRESPVRVKLAVALPKGDRQQFLIEKCCELGVAGLVPLKTHFSVAEPGERACRRLRRYVIEASKQCGRNRLMQIGEPIEIMELLNSASEQFSAKWFLDVDSSRWAGDVPRPAGGPVLVAIGPEAGWSDGERQAADRGSWSRISLGARILRVETAAVAIAAWCGFPHNGA